MTEQCTIRVRAVGQKRPLVPDWSLPWPPRFGPEGEPLTLRELITRIVRAEVVASRQRQREQHLVRILTARQIDDGLAKGRVVPGGRDLNQPVDDDQTSVPRCKHSRMVSTSSSSTARNSATSTNKSGCGPTANWSSSG